MDFDRKNFLVNRIITGYVPVIYISKLYKVYDPTPETNYLADIYINDIKEDLRLDYILDNDALHNILAKRQLWTDKMQEELDLLEKDQSRILKEMVQNEQKIKSREQERLTKTLEYNRKRCHELYLKRENLSINSIEYMLKLEKLRMLLFLNTYDEHNNRVWLDWKEFENGVADTMIKYLLTKSYLNAFINESEIRLLARTDPWRLYWRTATKVGKLFNHPSTQMTDSQRILVSWSMLYDSLYESAEPPSSNIINDDNLLDGWLLLQSNKNKNSNHITDNEKIKNSQEIGIVVNSPEDIDKVYSLNDSKGISILSAREDKLHKDGKVEEMDMPDTKRDFIEFRNKLGQSSIKNRAKNG